MGIKRAIKDSFYQHGYNVSFRGISRFDHLHDIKAVLCKSEAETIFDVGANKGQTLSYFYPFFKKAHIYCFEPDPEAFGQLAKAAEGLNRVSVCNIALGALDERRTLYVNQASEGNSLLRVAKNVSSENAPGWLAAKGEKEVSVSTLDRFCQEHAIESIDLLKIDSQGYEAEVLRGATRLLSEKAIRLVFMEVLFTEYYENQAYFEGLYSLMKSNGYKLIDLYQKSRREDRSLLSCDALFVS